MPVIRSYQGSVLKWRCNVGVGRVDDYAETLAVVAVAVQFVLSIEALITHHTGIEALGCQSGGSCPSFSVAL
jgi:hypothetical protein